ncbi:MAG: ABC transporter permease [Candidatus Omnitrophica bacterium]|nr:ABC transporter permease [Candidatus Omnitrophota bacterium]MCB9746945.1 ABC transporter permease [Candidatus Omnitrophota bacterium]
MNTLSELINYRGLLLAFIQRNIKIKYKQTVMGFMWAIFMPIMIVISGIIVRNAMAMLSGKTVNFAEIASVSVKSLPWAFFIGALKFSVGSLVSNMNILKKIYFPRVIFPLSYILGQLFDFIIAGVAFSIILALAHIGGSIHLLWLPVLVIFLILFTAGCGLILSCGNLFYRDVKYIVDVVLTFAIFFTPVFYDAATFGRWESLLLLNPIGALLENINAVVVLHQAPNFFWLTYSGVWGFGLFFAGWFIFHKAEPSFADKI